jgi:cystathionine beta-synthase
VLKKYKETGILDRNEIYPYITEGIGEDFLPENVDFDVIDHFEKVTDKDAAVMTRRITREEGIFGGNSAGAAMAGLLQMKDRFKKGDVVVVIFHDHGTRYLGKMFNDDWMREKGFLDKKGLTARDLVATKASVPLKTLDVADSVAHAAQLMTEHGFSQVPVTSDGRIVGAISEERIYAELVKNPDIRTSPVEKVMGPPFRFADISIGIEALAAMMASKTQAVLVRDFKTDEIFIITRSDVIKALS